MKTVPWFAVLCGVAVFSMVLTGGSMADPAASEPVKNIVLVHGAFADGSSWSKVVAMLQDKGTTSPRFRSR